jgi:enterochelin esterase-like enzyme
MQFVRYTHESNRLSRFIVGLVTLLLVSCGGGSGDGGDEAEFAGTIEPESSLQAKFNGVHNPIQVYLPADYTSNPIRGFPVLLVLDGEWQFNRVSQLADELAKSVIVVGIGNVDQLVEGQRAIDYRMPGAGNYFDFLVSEVLPYIENNYID